MPKKLSNETEEYIIHAYPMVKCDNPDCGKEFCRPTRESQSIWSAPSPSRKQAPIRSSAANGLPGI